MKILHVVGARPNFVKVAPVCKALQEEAIVSQIIVHTGQHYDGNMSKIFFRELGIPEPDINLQVGSGSHAQQTAAIMERFEPVVQQHSPDLVLVYGDVNSTAAAALVCAKLQIFIGHVEAGLRSFDRTMPEEINRVVADCLTNVLFTHCENANENLMREGIAEEKIFLVGNVMIDTLMQLLPLTLDRYNSLARKFCLGQYGLVTLHRPSNVDDEPALFEVFDALEEISRDLPLIFPVHPRTRARLHSRPRETTGALLLLDPLGYLDFLALERNARLVITDSGGIQEETTCLGVPCLTLRESTERPVTVELGTNILVGHDLGRLRQEVHRILAGKTKAGRLPPFWDGQASRRIAQVLTAGNWHGSAISQKALCART